MSERTSYPAGVPCWVEAMQIDPKAALDFYVPLFGWEIAGPGPMPGDPPGEYYVARIDGRDVAGICSLPRSGLKPVWSTYVRVDNVDATVDRAKLAGGNLLDGPFDVPPAGRMAVLADPAGAIFCIWEATAREGAQRINEPSAWAMSALHTSDPKRANEFYGAVFGWEPEPFALPNGAEVVLWRLPGYVGGEPQQPVPRDVVAVMVTIGKDSALTPHWSVDFWIDDADAAAARAAKLGGKIIVPPYDTPTFRQAVLADAQGATFSISQLTAY